MMKTLDARSMMLVLLLNERQNGDDIQGWHAVLIMQFSTHLESRLLNTCRKNLSDQILSGKSMGFS